MSSVSATIQQVFNEPGCTKNANKTEAERKKGQAWGLQTISSFHTHGTPPLPGEPLIPERPRR